MNSSSEIIGYLFNNYVGISLFPVFFFIAGNNVNYFGTINKILTVYIILASTLSFIFLEFFELQVFLLYPLFYMILTIPLRKTGGKWLIVLISVAVIIVSLTNRAGILRILISYCIIAVYYVMLNIKINKKLLYLIVFVILMIPVFSLYLGIKGQSVFQTILGDDNQPYSQLDPYADTRTFMYYEVFQDLKGNDAFLFGKGLGAGYYSEAFVTFSRNVVEVGFLQIILKTGIFGFLLYISVIISAIYKALGKSNSLFIKSIGLLLASYVLMLFIENIIAYNILNVLVWTAVGMCHSASFRDLDDHEIKNYFRETKISVNKLK